MLLPIFFFFFAASFSKDEESDPVVPPRNNKSVDGINKEAKKGGKLDDEDNQLDDDVDEKQDDSINTKVGNENIDDELKEAEYSDYDPSDYYPEYNCTSPNVYKTSDGYCECVENFTGDPYSENGCFMCKEECIENADCVFPGVCKCSYGYHGNGTVRCDKTYPKIISVSPNISFTDGNILVNFTFDYDVEYPYNGFCKFGDNYVNSEFISGNIIACRSPPRQPQILNVAISFDGNLWSKEIVTFEYKNQFNALTIIPFVLFYLACIGGISLLLFFLFRNRKGNGKPTKDEKMPFIDIENPKKRRRGTPRRRGRII